MLSNELLGEKFQAYATQQAGWRSFTRWACALKALHYHQMIGSVHLSKMPPQTPLIVKRVTPYSNFFAFWKRNQMVWISHFKSSKVFHILTFQLSSEKPCILVNHSVYLLHVIIPSLNCRTYGKLLVDRVCIFLDWIYISITGAAEWFLQYLKICYNRS